MARGKNQIGKWGWDRKRFEQLRLSMNMNRNEFAKLVGTTQNEIAKIEDGIHKPSMDMFEKIVNETSMSPSYFCTFFVD